MKSIWTEYTSGKLDAALDAGVVKQSVITYIKIYKVYIVYREEGMTYTEAVRKTANVVCAAEITVKKAIAHII